MKRKRKSGQDRSDGTVQESRAANPRRLETAVMMMAVGLVSLPKLQESIYFVLRAPMLQHLAECLAHSKPSTAFVEWMDGWMNQGNSTGLLRVGARSDSEKAPCVILSDI